MIGTDTGSNWQKTDRQKESHPEILAALDMLDMLDMNLALPEDASIHLEFLSTPPGQFGSGHSEFQRRLDEIDYDSPRARLRHVLPYSRFLQSQKSIP